MKPILHFLFACLVLLYLAALLQSHRLDEIGLKDPSPFGAIKISAGLNIDPVAKKSNFDEPGSAEENKRERPKSNGRVASGSSGLSPVPALHVDGVGLKDPSPLGAIKRSAGLNIDPVAKKSNFDEPGSAEENNKRERPKSNGLPHGVASGSSGLSPVPALDVAGIGNFAAAGRHYQNTFAVEEKHERLPSGGVKFNVETVPAAEESHLKKPTITREDFLRQIRVGASDIYLKQSDRRRPIVRLEAVSKTPENTVFVGGQGFFAAILSAFAQHLPLAISPDHMWALISYAFAKHVDNHAEELRSAFVQHEGKKRLEVVADNLHMSDGDNPDSGSSEVWEETVFSSFSKQIKEHLGEKIHSAIASDFSSTTATCRAAHEITLMSTTKNYFSYGATTSCGIPSITLLGSEEDWVSLRARAEALGELMTPEFSALWMPILLPVLDEFVLSYKGTVNHGFWQSMVKLRYRGGSGARSEVSGWLQILFPYLKRGSLNTNLRPWQEMYFSGPKPDEIPSVLSSAPVDWNYYGTIYDLHFNAGFTGCMQDPSDGTLTPVMGWYVTHDPPTEPKERLEVIDSEIKALVTGHAEEAKAKAIDKNQPWYRRVKNLFLERKDIYGSLMEKLEADGAGYARDLKLDGITEREKQRIRKAFDEIEAEKGLLEAAPTFGSVEDMIQASLKPVNFIVSDFAKIS